MHVNSKCFMCASLLQVLLSEARVLALGPKFMSIYVPQLTVSTGPADLHVIYLSLYLAIYDSNVNALQIERRIYYDEVEGLNVEWLEATSTLVLTLTGHKSSRKAFSVKNVGPLEDSVLVVSPLELDPESNFSPSSTCASVSSASDLGLETQPLVFPVTVSLLSKIPIALHAVGGEGGPMDICARLYGCSYLR